MTRTPAEIKKGLECCGKGLTWDETCGTGCPYQGMYITGCAMEISADALALIQQLQDDNAEKDVRIQQLETERDAAVEELKNAYSCFACKRFNRNGGECNAGGVCMMRDFEWRGVQKEE